jgi:alkylation response protein AidB-like acyl-CoA dehydrogenase
VSLDDSERRALADLARALAGEYASSAAVRAVLAEHGTPDQRLDAELARAGLVGIEIPDRFGGSGAGFAELALVVETLGAHAAPSRLTATAVMCAGAILLGGSEEQRSRWLPGLADGSTAGTAVLGEFASARPGPAAARPGPAAARPGPAADPAAGIRAEPRADGWRLHGTAGYVLDARIADLVVVSTAGPAGSGPDPAVVAVVPAGAPGLASEPVELVDGTRCADTVSFSGVRVTEADVLARGAAARQLTTALANRAAVALAADSVGAARRLLEMTVAYSKQREQFGRPIGGFQAVKHQAADMLVNVETSAALLDGAVREAGESPFSAGLASMAKEYCCERAAATAGTALQLHGGIGYTWEHDLHLYFKRIVLNQYLFGDGRWHRQRVAARVADR